jgi:hypothetical protein
VIRSEIPVSPRIELALFHELSRVRVFSGEF